MPLRGEEVYDANITHNLGGMADTCGVYKACWRPDEAGLRTAGELAPILRAGLGRLKADPDKYRAFDAENGWGTYAQFVKWLDLYLQACDAYPTAFVEVSR